MFRVHWGKKTFKEINNGILVGTEPMYHSMPSSTDCSDCYVNFLKSRSRQDVPSGGMGGGSTKTVKKNPKLKALSSPEIETLVMGISWESVHSLNVIK